MSDTIDFSGKDISLADSGSISDSHRPPASTSPTGDTDLSDDFDFTEAILTLEKDLHQRRSADPKDSYTASLFNKGINKILEKVGEEAFEVVLAAKDTQDVASRVDLISEVADLWYHLAVMLRYLNIPQSAIFEELKKRQGTSGHTEKAHRLDQQDTSLQVQAPQLSQSKPKQQLSLENETNGKPKPNNSEPHSIGSDHTPTEIIPTNKV